MTSLSTALADGEAFLKRTDGEAHALLGEAPYVADWLRDARRVVTALLEALWENELPPDGERCLIGHNGRLTYDKSLTPMIGENHCVACERDAYRALAEAAQQHPPAARPEPLDHPCLEDLWNGDLKVSAEQAQWIRQALDAQHPEAARPLASSLTVERLAELLLVVKLLGSPMAQAAWLLPYLASPGIPSLDEYHAARVAELEAKVPHASQPCDRCDGCGWYEGGKTLKTNCEKCGGTGVLPRLAGPAQEGP